MEKIFENTKENIVDAVKNDTAKKWGYKDFNDASSSGVNNHLLTIYADALDTIADSLKQSTDMISRQIKLLDYTNKGWADANGKIMELMKELRDKTLK